MTKKIIFLLFIVSFFSVNSVLATPYRLNCLTLSGTTQLKSGATADKLVMDTYFDNWEQELFFEFGQEVPNLRVKVVDEFGSVVYNQVHSVYPSYVLVLDMWPWSPSRYKFILSTPEDGDIMESELFRVYKPIL